MSLNTIRLQGKGIAVGTGTLATAYGSVKPETHTTTETAVKPETMSTTSEATRPETTSEVTAFKELDTWIGVVLTP